MANNWQIPGLAAGFLLLCLGAIGSSPAIAGKPALGAHYAMPRALPDQFGGSVSLADHRGKVCLVLAIDVRRLRRIKRWELALVAQFPDLAVLRIAMLPADSNLDRVTSFLQSRVPAGVSIGMDQHGVWTTAFDLAGKKPNLLVFSASGHLHSQHSGNFSQELLHRAVAAIRDAQQEGPMEQEPLP